MKYFSEQNCEVIVLETGMGGRLDATTAVPADVAVITPVAMDHSQWLGETLAEVAAEKAGIIVAGKPVLSSSQEPAAHDVIAARANELAAPIDFITEPLTGYGINLPGRHQRNNAALAMAATFQAGIPLNTDTVRAALSSIQWPGRFEKLPATQQHPDVILDAAHNPHAAESLVATWNDEYPGLKATIVFGAVEGKNTDRVLDILAPIAHHFHLTPIDSPRSLSSAQLGNTLPTDAPHTIHENLGNAISAAAQQQTGSPILICGSIFLIGQAKAMLRETTTRPSSQ